MAHPIDRPSPTQDPSLQKCQELPQDLGKFPYFSSSRELETLLHPTVEKCTRQDNCVVLRKWWTLPRSVPQVSAPPWPGPAQCEVSCLRSGTDPEVKSGQSRETRGRPSGPAADVLHGL